MPHGGYHGTVKMGGKVIQQGSGGSGGGNVNTNPYQQAAESMLSQGITSLSGTTGGAQGQQAAQQQQDQGYQTIQQQAQEANQLDQMLQDMGLTKEEEEKKSLAQKGKDFAQGIMTNLMGGGEGGNLDLTKEEAYANLPAGMHPLRKQYEYLAKKYGEGWKNTTQAKVLESYLSGVPVERGGGLGARDDTYGGSAENIDPELEKRRQDILTKVAAGMYTPNTLASLFQDLEREGIGADLTADQFFNFRQQLMAADPSPENQAYKSALPFASGDLTSGLGQFIPGVGAAKTFLSGFLPERDLTGYQQNIDPIAAAFEQLPVERDNQTGPIRPPGFMPIIPLPDPSQPEKPKYPFPIRPPFMPGPGVGIETVFNPMFLGPSFQGSPYTNQGVSPAFYEALRRFS